MPFDPTRLTLLVFDERLDGRAALRDLAQRAGIASVRLAADMPEAIARLRDDRVDAILIDDEARGALEFLHVLRWKTRGSVQETPVLLVVTPDNAAIQAARDAGVTEVIARPASVTALRERLEEMVLRPRRFIRTAGYVGPCRRRRKPKGLDRPERRGAGAPEATSRSRG
ncbi:MAG: hypothetical protein JNK67_05285 [Alphaproteobacteria bacterium]|nr:hypothetical protein [Alphaproteobacteria bacterium]